MCVKCTRRPKNDFQWYEVGAYDGNTKAERLSADVPLRCSTVRTPKRETCALSDAAATRKLLENAGGACHG